MMHDISLSFCILRVVQRAESWGVSRLKAQQSRPQRAGVPLEGRHMTDQGSAQGQPDYGWEQARRAGYPAPQAPYPGADDPYTGQSEAYPGQGIAGGQGEAYPGHAGAAYQDRGAAYPGQGAAYPGQGDAYRGQGGPYPGTAQYPAQGVRYNERPHGSGNSRADSAKGFVVSLFDFGFDSFVTPKIVKIVYVLIMTMLSLSTLAFLYVAFRTSLTFGIVSLVIIAPLYFFVWLALWRIFLEIFVVIFRVADDIRALRDRGDLR
jgi:hypothetical protein